MNVDIDPLPETRLASIIKVLDLLSHHMCGSDYRSLCALCKDVHHDDPSIGSYSGYVLLSALSYLADLLGRQTPTNSFERSMIGEVKDFARLLKNYLKEAK